VVGGAAVGAAVRRRDDSNGDDNDDDDGDDSDAKLAEALAAMLRENPRRRPSAGEALALAYFADGEAAAAAEALAAAERERLGPELACAVCLERVPEALGAACPRGVAAHFVCDACLSAKVLHDSRVEEGGFVARGGRVYCVGHTLAAGDGDNPCAGGGGEAYGDAELARHASCEAFAAYSRARSEVVRAELERKADERVAAELERLLAMDAEQRRVAAAATHVREHILTLRCPPPNGACGQAFVDFEGCFALECGRCRGHFCGWCLAWCGGDAHQHVRQCRNRLSADPFYGTPDEFERSNRERRQRQLDRYLGAQDADLARRVRRELARELADLGLR